VTFGGARRPECVYFLVWQWISPLSQTYIFPRTG
jgi:hypothetical protein